MSESVQNQTAQNRTADQTASLRMAALTRVRAWLAADRARQQASIERRSCCRTGGCTPRR